MGKLYTYQPQKTNNGFVYRRWSAFGHALRGIGLCCSKETHFQLQGLLALLVIAAGLLLGLSKWEWVATALCIVVVLALEAINSAIEQLCNVVRPDFHPGIKVVKDVAAGAVLIAAMGSFAVGCLIFLPKFFSLF